MGAEVGCWATAMVMFAGACLAQTKPQPNEEDKQLSLNWLYGAYVPKRCATHVVERQTTVPVVFAANFYDPGNLHEDWAVQRA
jgi:hypothetical protein